MAEADNKQIDIEQTDAGQTDVRQTDAGQAELGAAGKPRQRGSFFERRYQLYDHIKLSVKTLDIIIAAAVILLFIVFILGVYKR